MSYLGKYYNPDIEVKRTFSNAVEKQLRNRLKGDVKVYFYKYDLYVEISVSYCEVYKADILNLFPTIAQGNTAELVAIDIMSEYKKNIFNKFFK